MKRFLLIFIAIIGSIFLFAQSDTIKYEDLQKEYDDFIKHETAAFEKFKEDRDKEFSEFLKQDWENFELFKQGNPIQVPGPKEIPVFEEETQKLSIKKISEKKLTEIKLPELTSVQMNLRPLPKPQKLTAKKDYAFLEMGFYGTDLAFIYPKKFNNLKLVSVNEKEIAEFWTKASEADHYRLIEQMLEYKNEMNLNDFAFLMLTQKIASSILSSENDQRLLTWFLLSKTGYKIKIGYEKQNIHLLIPIVNLIYSYSYFVFDNLKYYVFEKDCQIGTIYTYEQDYPNANKIMNFNMYVAPIFKENLLSRDLKFSFENKDYNFLINYNKNLIDFCADYPQGEVQIFFNAGISQASKESLDRCIDSAIFDMDEIVAANFLLHFTQTAFSYQTDGEQFGYEKFFFPEEIFYYKYADCEDRSVFYSYLVNEYLNLPVVGLNYPGHIATAVKFSEKTDGMYFQIGDDRYVICDPTYINAPVGACMPEYVKSDVSVLKLNNSHISLGIEDVVWGALLEKGFVRTNFKNDIIKTADGNYFTTGILQDSIVVNGNLIRVADSDESLFICKTDETGKILDLKQIVGKEFLMPVGINMFEDKVYISGYYNKQLEFSNEKLETESVREMFIAAFDADLNKLWIKNTGAIQENEKVEIYFNVFVTKNGDVVQNSEISEQSYYTQKPVSFSEDKLVFTGYFNSVNPYLAESDVYASKNSYEFAIALNELTQSFIAKNYEEDAAPLFAFLTILQGGKLKLKSKDILAASLAMNPEFEKEYPKLYKNLRDIINIKSRNEIITINVTTFDDFRIGGLIIDDNARISIKSYKSGNIQIAALSGISYKPFLKKHKVNYIKLYKSSGNLVIDYDEDNDQKVINVREHLLK
jgi:hypothetical protein